MQERIQQLNGVTVLTTVTCLVFIAHNFFYPLLIMGMLRNLLKNFNFVVCSFLVVACTFLNFQGYKRIMMHVSRKPDCREMAPSKLLKDDVSLDHHFANMNRVVATNFVVCYSFIFALVRISDKFIDRQIISQRFRRVGLLLLFVSLFPFLLLQSFLLVIQFRVVLNLALFVLNSTDPVFISRLPSSVVSLKLGFL